MLQLFFDVEVSPGSSRAVSPMPTASLRPGSPPDADPRPIRDLPHRAECHFFRLLSIPEGVDYFVEPPADLNKPRGMVCKLKKALYGLRQSPIWKQGQCQLRQGWEIPKTEMLSTLRNSDGKPRAGDWLTTIYLPAIPLEATPPSWLGHR
jgi:hypothetical protein